MPKCTIAMHLPYYSTERTTRKEDRRDLRTKENLGTGHDVRACRRRLKQGQIVLLGFHIDIILAFDHHTTSFHVLLNFCNKTFQKFLVSATLSACICRHLRIHLPSNKGHSVVLLSPPWITADFNSFRFNSACQFRQVWGYSALR